jgi:hypothetical protein
MSICRALLLCAALGLVPGAAALAQPAPLDQPAPPEGWVQADTPTGAQGAWLHAASLATLELRGAPADAALWRAWRAKLADELKAQGARPRGEPRGQALPNKVQATVQRLEVALRDQTFTLLLIDLQRGDQRWQLSAAGLPTEDYPAQQLEQDALALAQTL